MPIHVYGCSSLEPNDPGGLVCIGLPQIYLHIFSLRNHWPFLNQISVSVVNCLLLLSLCVERMCWLVALWCRFSVVFSFVIILLLSVLSSLHRGAMGCLWYVVVASWSYPHAFSIWAIP